MLDKKISTSETASPQENTAIGAGAETSTSTSLCRVLFGNQPTGMLPTSALRIERFPNELLKQFHDLKQAHAIEISGDRGNSTTAHPFYISSNGRFVGQVVIGEGSDPVLALRQVTDAIEHTLSTSFDLGSLRLPNDRASDAAFVAAREQAPLPLNDWTERDNVASYARQNGKWLLAHPESVTGPYKGVAFAESIMATVGPDEETAKSKDLAAYLLELAKQERLTSTDLGMIAGEIKGERPDSILPALIFVLAHVGTGETIREDIQNMKEAMPGFLGTRRPGQESK